MIDDNLGNLMDDHDDRWISNELEFARPPNTTEGSAPLIRAYRYIKEHFLISGGSKEKPCQKNRKYVMQANSRNGVSL
jgi:hypothetical protein